MCSATYYVWSGVRCAKRVNTHVLHVYTDIGCPAYGLLYNNDRVAYVVDCNGGEQMADSGWEPSDDDLAAMESNVFGHGPDGETPVATARRLFDENAAQAAMTIVQLCRSGSTDRIRFESSKYVLERAMGPVSKDENAAQDELLAFYQKITGVGA
jgi:hypothetical protein